MISSVFPALLGFVVHAQLVAPLPRVPLPHPAANAVSASVHQNVVAAGIRRGNVLSLTLEVIESKWKPEGDTDP
ncbi:MAG: hypothetical protein ABI877_15690, partial [Gemmatimonadaceae bacterium]